MPAFSWTLVELYQLDPSPHRIHRDLELLGDLTDRRPHDKAGFTTCSRNFLGHALTCRLLIAGTLLQSRPQSAAPPRHDSRFKCPRKRRHFMHRCRVTRVVHEELLARPVTLPHHHVLPFPPAPVQLAKPAVSIAFRLLLPVLLPHQPQRQPPVLLQILVDRPEIRPRSLRLPSHLLPLSVQPLLQPLLIQTLRQWPAQACLPGSTQHPVHRALCQPATPTDLSLCAARLMAQPQNLCDLVHRYSNSRHRNLPSARKSLPRTSAVTPAWFFSIGFADSFQPDSASSCGTRRFATLLR